MWIKSINLSIEGYGQLVIAEVRIYKSHFFDNSEPTDP